MLDYKIFFKGVLKVKTLLKTTNVQLFYTTYEHFAFDEINARAETFTQAG